MLRAVDNGLIVSLCDILKALKKLDDDDDDPPPSPASMNIPTYDFTSAPQAA